MSKNKQMRNQLKATQKLFGDDHELVISKSGEMYYKKIEKQKKKSSKFGLGLFIFTIALATVLFLYVNTVL